MVKQIDAAYRELLRRSGPTGWRRQGLLICAAFVREAKRDQIPVRAATLAYWSLVTIVPVLILAAALLQPITPAGQVPFHELALGALLAGPVQGVGTTVDNWLGQVDLAKLGAVGIIGVLFTSSRIYFSIEDAYNALWNTRPRRSLVTRLILFYTTVTLGPLLITAGFQLSGVFEAHVGGGWLRIFAPAAVTASAFVALIRALPDTDVRWRPALIGGLASAIAFELAKVGFGSYTRLLGAEDAAAKIYGSLGLFPVFLVWLYTLWVIVLFGVELAYVVQRRHDLAAAEERRLGGEAYARRMPDALFALQCLMVVAERFAAGHGPTPEPAVTRALGTDPNHCEAALETLEATGILADSPVGYLPAVPLHLLTVRDVLVRYREFTRPQTSSQSPGRDLLDELFGTGLGRLDVPLSELAAAHSAVATVEAVFAEAD